MLFIKINETNLPYTLSKAVGPTFLYNSRYHHLLIMHTCDTFCDELILLLLSRVHNCYYAIMLFQSTGCNYFNVNIPVFMKYVVVQVFKTMM